MSRRAALNLLLLGAVAVLAALVFLQPGIETPPPVPTLTDRAPDSVARLRIERSGQTAVLLEKREGRWLMVEPLSLPANGFRIQTLLEVLGAATERSYRVQDLELARFGLEPPQASLVLDDLRLDFGDTESLSGRRYLRVGDRVHLVTDRFYHLTVSGAPGFVHLGPLGPEPQPVAIEVPELTLRLQEGRWVAEPEHPEAGADAVQGLVDAWRTAQAITVRALEPPGAGRPVTVTLTGQGEPLHFLVSETPHALVLARPDAGVQYHLPVESGDRLLRLRAPAPPGDGAVIDGAEGPEGPGESPVGSEGGSGVPGEGPGGPDEAKERAEERAEESARPR